MANYSLVVNSKFRPYSFDELVKPYMMYGQAYDEQLNELSDLAVKANVWKGLANEQTDPTAYKMYKTYADDLEARARMLAKEGLTPASRKSMLDMKTRYSSEITPIETAYKKREELAKEQRALRALDTSAMFDVDYSTASLDKLLANPSASYIPVSGNDLAKRAAEMGLPLSKVISPETNRTLKTILGNQYALIQMGASPQDVMATINNDKNAPPELRKIIDTVYSTSGLDTFDDASLKKGMAHIIRGLYSTIGGSNPVANGEYMNRAQRTSAAMLAAGLALEREKFNYTKAQQQSANSLALNPSNIYSSRELDKNEKKYKNNMKNFSKYFYKDSHGQMRMTYEGWKEYNRKIKGTITGTVMTTPEGTTIRVADTHNGETPSAFRQFMDSIGAYKVTKGKWQPGNLGNVWGKYAEASPAARTAKYDATRTSEYIYDVSQSPEYQRNYKAKLSRAIGSDKEFKEVDYNPKTNKWEYTGNTLSFADFDTDKYTLVSRAPSELGNTLFIKKDGEKAKRYMAPPGINATAEGGRDQVFAEMLAVQRRLQSPKLSPTQRAKLESHYDNLTQQQAMFESQIDVINSTKNQEFSPYYIP